MQDAVERGYKEVVQMILQDIRVDHSSFSIQDWL
jgi:hypothetical protein